jgi:DNA polymerase-3 subunit delta'
VLVLDAHPHARAVLGAALEDAPAHAYLLHGPPGSGKQETARAFAGELLAKGAKDPDNARQRAKHGAHPDLTWVTPSGAHEMLRRDVAESVVAAAAHTPFEAQHRIFVLERADTMNDEAANALLKTLEEPPAYVVLILLTDKPTQVLPTIASRCQAVRFDPPAPGQLAHRLQSQGVPPETAEAAARLSLGDAHKALRLALGDGPALRAAAEHLARAPLHGTTGTTRPWKTVLDRARQRGQQAKQEVESALQEELQYLPKKEHKRRETEFNERARRADRRAATEALDHALQLTGLWYRDLACVAAGAPELAFHSDRAQALEEDAGRSPKQLQRAQELVDDTRARLILNVSEELACEALAYRLEEVLSPSSSSA